LAPFTRTTAPSTKLAPLTVNVNAAPPTSFEEGARLLIDGTGLPTVKEADVDVPPPGVALVTVTGYVPELVTSDARIAAVNWVGLTKVVTRATLLNLTTDVLRKLVPSTVNVNAPEPTVLDVGERVVIVGSGLLTVKLITLEVPPPGAGLNTVTGVVPAAAISAAVICAVNWFAFTNVVTRSAPFQRTFESGMKLDPPTVSVKAEAPANTLFGVRVLRVGDGLVLAIVKLTALEVPPPGAGLTTVNGLFPAVATSAAVIWAFNILELTKVVARALPFHWTTEALMKLPPLSVNSNAALPSTTCEGDRLASVGTGFGPTTVSVTDPDMPPPGAGLKTVTAGVPALTTSAAVMAAVSWF